MASMISFVTILAFMISAVPSTAQAENVTVAGKFTVEPPTLQCAGFEWYIEGDDNRTASVAVSYREQGSEV